MGCKRARSYSLDENVGIGGRFGGRYLPIGGPIASIGGANMAHGHQRLFVKNSFSSATDISTSTPVVPEDNELPATLVTPQTRSSLGNESIGVLSGGISSGSDSAPAINRVSPEAPIRLTIASASQGRMGYANVYAEDSINSGLFGQINFELIIHYYIIIHYIYIMLYIILLYIIIIQIKIEA